MKRKLSKLSFIVFAFAIFFSGMAQNTSHSKHDQRTETNFVKKSLPAGWDKSVDEVLFYEDFSGGIDDWTVVGEGADNWTAANTGNAGGVAPELRMAYSPIFLGTSRIVSPVINTTGYTELGLSFLHFLDAYNTGGYWLSVETTSDGGDTWNQVWELYWETTNNYAAFEVLSVSTSDVGSADFQFCFKFEDNSDLLDGWYIDNVTLGEPIMYDVTPTSISGVQGTYYDGDDITASSVVKNYGSETVSFDVLLEISDGSTVVFESTKSVSDLAFGESSTVDFDAWTAAEGSYTATVTTLLVDDEVTDNDMLSFDFTVFSAEYYCIPGGDCTWGDGFTDFAFAGIENYGSGCSNNGYGSYLGMTAYVEIGYTYTVTMASGYGSQQVSIWVDFNQDLVFGSDELILTDFPIDNADEFVEVDVMIPANAMAGTTVMRIGAAYYEPSSPDPCALLFGGSYGEFEDYTIEITGEAINYNVGVVSIDINPIIESGDVTPKATVVNQGLETVSFPVTLTIDDGYSSTVNVTDLAYGESLQVSFDLWSVENGVYELVAETELEGDEMPGNDMKTKTVSAVDLVPEKNVVGEEGTGTWCGWCVRGTVFMDYMATTYPETWIGIAVHNGDPMVVDEYDAGIGPFIGYAYPGGLVDRTIACDPSVFENAYETQMQEIPVATIMLENQVFNPSTGELSFTVTSEFVAAAPDYRFNAVLIEDGLSGTTSGWAQANYYSGGAQGPMGGFEDLPNPVPAADMVYDHVARAILGGWDGVSGSLPADIQPGETHSYTFETVLEEGMNWENMTIVGMLINQENGAIDNATHEVVLFTGVNDVKASNVKIYPNPASDRVNIQAEATINNVKVYNRIGQLVYEQNAQSKVMNFNTSDFETGLYILKIETIDGLIVESVIIK